MLHILCTQGMQRHFFNNYHSNVTGFMVMMTTGILLENNTVENHSDYNGYGMLLYDVQRASIAKNIIKNNRTGLALQKKFDDSN